MKLLKLSVVVMAVLAAFAFKTPSFPEKASGTWSGFTQFSDHDYQEVNYMGPNAVPGLCSGELYRCGFIATGFVTWEEALAAAHEYESVALHYPRDWPFITPEGGVITFYFKGIWP